MVQRYMFKDVVSDDNIMRDALIFALDLAKKNNCMIHFTFLTKKGFPPTALSKCVDRSFFESLVKGGTKPLSGISVDFILPKDLEYVTGGIIFAPFLTSKLLDTFDNQTEAEHVIFLPWLDTEGDKWERTWKGQVEIVNGTPTANTYQLPKEVEDELLRLTGRINISTGLTHPADKQAATTIFKELKKKGYKIESNHITEWALGNGWQERHLKTLGTLADRYLS